MKNLFHLCLVAMLFALPALSKAACTVTVPTGSATPKVLWLDGVATRPPIRFDPTVPDGTVLTRILTAEGAAGFQFTCPNGIGNVIQKPSASLSSLGNNIYNSSVPGVGYRITFTPGSGVFPGQIVPVTDSRWASQTDSGHISLDPRLYPLTIELIKTGPITAGGTLSGEAVGWYAENGASEVLSIIWPPGALIIAPQVPTCSVTSRSISVPLGNVPVSAFTTVGSTSPSTEPFNITLQCSGGATGAVTSVYTTLTDQTNPANLSNTLTLTPNSKADGVGIQVLNGTNVISYGPDSNVAGNMNQWYAGAAANGTFNIPLTARYIKTSQTITPGKADGRATFTMSYQ